MFLRQILTAMAANSCLNLRQAIEIAAVDSPGTVPSSAEILAGLANISAETVRGVPFSEYTCLRLRLSMLTMPTMPRNHGSSWASTSTTPTCPGTS